MNLLGVRLRKNAAPDVRGRGSQIAQRALDALAPGGVVIAFGV